MNHVLLPYYERELAFIRKTAAEFAAQYPDRAPALKLTRSGGCDDPHVERIIEAFALVAGRIQHRLDEEFPEITKSLLELLYPHLIRPVPSLVTIQFAVDPELSKQRTGVLIPRGSPVYSRAINNVQCRFRTAYPTHLWPIEISAAAFRNSGDFATGISDQSTRHAVRIEFQLLGGNKLSNLDLDQLRLHISGESQTAHWLYEVLFNKVRRIVVRPLSKDGKPEKGANDPAVFLRPDAIRPFGFAREEALLPFAETSFHGYRLLQEYFTYPQKFLFFDLVGLGGIARDASTDRFEVVLLIETLEQLDRAALLETTTNRETFQLGCTPAINLFEKSAEPIRFSHTKTEYEVIPDLHSPAGFEVYSIDRVVSVEPNTATPKEYHPFYSFHHGAIGGPAQNPESFWFGFRRLATRPGDSGTDYFISMIDRNFKVSQPVHEAITAQLTCSNRNLPLELGMDGSWGELDLESGPLVRARALHGPTHPLRAGFSGSLQWKLISHLSLNHLSLVEGGVEALREILRLYDPSDSDSSSGQIEGLTAVRSTRKIARVDSEHGFVFCQGIAIDAEMDEDRFAGGGAFLLASTLERFFGLYCAVNSFTQLRVSTRQRKGIVWQWPIRSGEQGVA